MFSPKKALLSVALCAALTAPSQASYNAGQDDDDNKNVATNSNTYSTAPAAPAAPWDIEASNAAKIANKGTSLMSLPIWPLQQLSQIFVENDCPEAILALGLTSSHLTGSILGWNYPDPCQDEDTRINNPTIQQAIRIDLRNAINAREEAFMTLQKASEDQPKARPLAPWRELLGENASLHHLIRALKMLSPQNVERLRTYQLLERLGEMSDRKKSFFLAANASILFPAEPSAMQRHGIVAAPNQEEIIAAAATSTRPLSDYLPLLRKVQELYGIHIKANVSNCFDEDEQATFFATSLRSIRPISALKDVYQKITELFTDEMDDYQLTNLTKAALIGTCSPQTFQALSDKCAFQLTYWEEQNRYTPREISRAHDQLVVALLPLRLAEVQQIFTKGAEYQNLNDFLYFAEAESKAFMKQKALRDGQSTHAQPQTSDH